MIIFADHLKCSEKKMKFIFLIILLIFFAFDLYAFQIFKALKLSKAFENVYWIFNIIGYLLIIYSVMFYDPQGHKTKILPFIIGYTILLGVPKLIPILLGTAEDLFRIGNRFISGEWSSRRRFIALIGWGAAAVPFIGILHGIFLGRSQYRVLNNSVAIKNLPDEFNGFKILQISDIHSGSFVNFKEVEIGINMILDQDVDAIVFTGDLVNNVYSEMTPWIDLFKKINAPYGVFSILGNHDYGDYVKWDSAEDKNKNMENLFETHKKLGWKLLRNENFKISKNGRSIDIVGVENWGNPPFPKYGNLDMALKGLDLKTPKILLSHDPSHFDAEVINHESNIPLTLSGHTHGMQFGIEIPGWIKWSPVKFKYPKWAGSYIDEETKKSLYVNRGFGYLAFPGRVGIWPEITIHNLRKS
tara:strand:+ start:15292 stop:16536 length:1245 start_codon:yes stop_codon:yes gene_type:complete